jgi:hypothetical protein
VHCKKQALNYSYLSLNSGSENKIMYHHTPPSFIATAPHGDCNIKTLAEQLNNGEQLSPAQVNLLGAHTYVAPRGDCWKH